MVINQQKKNWWTDFLSSFTWLANLELCLTITFCAMVLSWIATETALSAQSGMWYFEILCLRRNMSKHISSQKSLFLQFWGFAMSVPNESCYGPAKEHKVNCSVLDNASELFHRCTSVKKLEIIDMIHDTMTKFFWKENWVSLSIWPKSLQLFNRIGHNWLQVFEQLYLCISYGLHCKTVI